MVVIGIGFGGWLFVGMVDVGGEIVDGVGVVIIGMRRVDGVGVVSWGGTALLRSWVACHASSWEGSG